MIKVLGNYQRKVINESGNYEVTFEITDYQSKKLIEELENQTYNIELKKPRSKRSINQNAYLWACIHEIAKVEEIEEMDIYCQLLDSCNAKYELIKTVEEAERTLKKAFRVVKLLKFDDVNSKYAYFKCYYGSSKFDTKEMTKLLENVLVRCYQNNINMEVYNGEIDYTRY